MLVVIHADKRDDRDDTDEGVEAFKDIWYTLSILNTRNQIKQ